MFHLEDTHCFISLFSTHILSDVEQICDRVAVLEQGEIAIEGTIDEIKSSHQEGAVTLTLGKSEEIDKVLKHFPEITRGVNHMLTLHSSNHLPEVLRYIADENIELVRLERDEVTLEDLFMEIISKER